LPTTALVKRRKAKAAALKPGEALLLENLRFYAEEEGKARGLKEDAPRGGG